MKKAQENAEKGIQCEGNRKIATSPWKNPQRENGGNVNGSYRRC